MSIRDLLLNILIGIGFVGFVIGVSVLETLPFWALIIVAAIVWLIYIVIVVRDHYHDIKYPLLRYRPAAEPKRPQSIYDQAKEKN